MRNKEAAVIFIRTLIDILRTDVVRTLKLLGCASVRELDRSYVSVPSDWLI